MTALTLKANRAKSAQSHLSEHERTFHRLKKRLDTLEKEVKIREQELDQALLFYHREIEPIERAIARDLTTWIKMLYGFYTSMRSLSHLEKTVLKDWIREEVDNLMEYVQLNELDPDVMEIFQKFEGVSLQQVFSGEVEAMKRDMEEMMQNYGVKIDLTNMDINDSDDDLMRKFAEAMEQAEENLPPERPKTKKQLEKERKREEFKQMQKRGIQTIYKQLVKALHPDLEQDSVVKGQKEQLMKRVTTAYESQDICTLLALEMEWIHGFSPEGTKRTDEQYKIYNSILKEQVEALKERNAMIVFHPKYLPIESFISEFGNGAVLHLVLVDLLESKRRLESLMKRHQGTNNETDLKQIIAARRQRGQAYR